MVKIEIFSEIILDREKYDRERTYKSKLHSAVGDAEEAEHRDGEHIPVVNSSEPTSFNAVGDAIHDSTHGKNRRHVDGSDDRWVRPMGHRGLTRDVNELRGVVIDRRKQLHVLKTARKLVIIKSRS